MSRRLSPTFESSASLLSHRQLLYLTPAVPAELINRHNPRCASALSLETIKAIPSAHIKNPVTVQSHFKVYERSLFQNFEAGTIRSSNSAT